MTISVAVNRRKGRKRKCRRLPTWGSMKCKVSSPVSCQLVYHSDCLLMITKMPANFFELPVVVSAVSMFPYLSKQHIEREDREKVGGERKWEWERRTSSMHYNYIHVFTTHQWNSVVLAVNVCSVCGELCIDCTESMNHFFSAILQGSGIHDRPLSLCSSKLCSQ